jgi:hypothetical protein
MILTKAIINIKPYNKGGRIQMPEGSGYSPYLEINQNLIAVRFHNINHNASFETDTNVDIEILNPDESNEKQFKKSTSFKIIEGIKIIGFGSF